MEHASILLTRPQKANQQVRNVEPLEPFKLGPAVGFGLTASHLHSELIKLNVRRGDAPLSTHEQRELRKVIDETVCERRTTLPLSNDIILSNG